MIVTGRSRGFTIVEVMVALAIVAFSLTAIAASMGQMIEDVERCVKGQRPVQWYGECGGDIPTPEEIVQVVTDSLK